MMGKDLMLQVLLSFWLLKMVQQKELYEVVTGLLEKMHWMPLNQVALATDGASSITGHHTRLAARFCAKDPTLINVYCIAHHEALAA